MLEQFNGALLPYKKDIAGLCRNMTHQLRNGHTISHLRNHEKKSDVGKIEAKRKPDRHLKACSYAKPAPLNLS